MQKCPLFAQTSIILTEQKKVKKQQNLEILKSHFYLPILSKGLADLYEIVEG